MKFCLVLLAHVILAGVIWFSFEKRKVENEHQVLAPEPESVVNETQSRESVSPLAGLMGQSNGSQLGGIEAIVRGQQARAGATSDQLAGIQKQLNAIQSSLKANEAGGAASPALSTENLLHMLGNSTTSEASIEARKQVESEMQKLLEVISKQQGR